jgi:hypothetical protein
MRRSLTEDEQIPICGRKTVWVPGVLLFFRMSPVLEARGFPARSEVAIPLLIALVSVYGGETQRRIQR